MNRTTLVGFLVFLMSVPCMQAQDDLDAVGHKIKHKLKALDAFHGVIEVTEFSSSGQKLRRSNTQDWCRSGRLVKFRIESEWNQMAQGPDGPESKRVQQTVVRDGKFIYIMRDENGTPTVVKQVAEREPDTDPVGPEKKKYKIKLLEDRKVLDRKCWVLEYTAKRDTKRAGTKRLSVFDQETGVPLVTEKYDRQGRLSFRSEFKQFEPGRAAPYETFVFKAPKGARVIDGTRPSASSPSKGILTKKLKSSAKPKRAAKSKRRNVG